MFVISHFRPVKDGRRWLKAEGRRWLKAEGRRWLKAEG